MEILKNEIEQMRLYDVIDELGALNGEMNLNGLIAMYAKYNEVYRVVRDKLEGPFPITEEDVDIIIRHSKASKRGVLVPSIQVSDFKETKCGFRLIRYELQSKSITWVEKAKVRKLNISTISDKPFAVQLPPMLFQYNGEELYNMTLKKMPTLNAKQIVTYSTILPNTYKDGHICLGENVINNNNIDSVIGALKYISGVFWNGTFNDYHDNHAKSKFHPYFEKSFKAGKSIPFPYQSLRKFKTIML